MANIDGTITGATCVLTDYSSTDASPIECWHVTADFAAYDDSADVARLVDVGAAITSRAADGKTRTATACIPASVGQDSAGLATLFFADSGVAVDGSSDDLTGDLGGTDHSGADRAASTGVGVLVYCTVA